MRTETIYSDYSEESTMDTVRQNCSCKPFVHAIMASVIILVVGATALLVLILSGYASADTGSLPTKTLASQSAATPVDQGTEFILTGSSLEGPITDPTLSDLSLGGPLTVVPFIGSASTRIVLDGPLSAPVAPSVSLAGTFLQ